MNANVHILASLIASLAQGICGVHVRWAGCRPEARQRIYFANHCSHLDFVVVWSALPREVRTVTRPVAAEDYWGTGIRGYLAQRVFHAILVRRRSPAERRNAAEALAESRNMTERLAEAMGTTNSLIIFPEGTRGTGESIGPFRSGLYYLAERRPEVELVPAYLENLSRILPKGEVLPVPLLSLVTFGEPLRLENAESKTSFLERARAAVQTLGRGQPR